MLLLLLRDNPDIVSVLYTLFYLLASLLVALTFHEASHALVATWLGDDTPKRAGRLSLNPFAHLEPFGLVMILLAGIGWGKPVPINGDKLRVGPKAGMALVALAGPISNLLLAFVLALPLRFHLVTFTPQRLSLAGLIVYFSAGTLFQMLVTLNLLLALFNLIPISPLDGSRLWQIILPNRLYYLWVRYEIFGVFVVVGLVLADAWLRTGILNNLLGPPLHMLWGPFVGWGAPPL